jgi:hypothetical protein
MFRSCWMGADLHKPNALIAGVDTFSGQIAIQTQGNAAFMERRVRQDKSLAT